MTATALLILISIAKIIIPLLLCLVLVLLEKKARKELEKKLGKQTYLTIGYYIVHVAICVLCLAFVLIQFRQTEVLADALSRNPLISIAVITILTVAATVILFALTNRVEEQEEARLGKQIHIKFLFNILKLFIILLALSTIGSQFTGFKNTVNTILASSGIIALGISLAAQASLTNIIDGIFISMFKPYNIGDRVSLPEKNNLTGFIAEMNLRHTVIRTFSNTSFIIPNALMSSAIIENSNFRNNTFAYPIDVSISYESNLELARSLVAQAISEHPDFVDARTADQIAAGAPAADVLVREFGDSGIQLRCMMRTADVNTSFHACSDARRTIKKLFDENNIVIPYTTIHIDNLK